MEPSGISGDHRQAVAGCILGTAIGDAIGLPCEGLSRSRQSKLFRNLNGHRFLFGRGMVSDDTEHTCMVAQALIQSAGEPDAFGRALARQLRVWLLGIPAGIGFATLRACLKLLFGAGWQRSGVFSAGNGPAMRSAILGVCFGAELPRLRQLVRVSTRITHTDPKTEYGAMAVALAAHMARGQTDSSPGEFLNLLESALPRDSAEPAAGLLANPHELIDLVDRAATSVAAGKTTAEFAESLGLADGVGGYVYHTVPVVLHAWFRHPRQFSEAVLEVVRCGGDTDTTAAILGGIVGSGLGADGLPDDWRAGLYEWPRSGCWMERLGHRLADVVASQNPGRPLMLPYALQFPRNLLFLLVVLAYGFRRLFPPY